jgi:hypothetical protein
MLKTIRKQTKQLGGAGYPQGAGFIKNPQGQATLQQQVIRQQFKHVICS